MKNTISILAFVTLLLFGSCSSIGYVSFERLEAGDVNYPDDIRRVGVVNNMPYFSFDNLNRSGFGMASLEGDGTIVADTLASLLASADYFDEVVICDSILRGTNISFAEPYALSDVLADSLIQAMGVDVLFSLDRVKVDLSVWQEPVGWNTRFSGRVKSVITPVMVAYVPGRKTPWFAISFMDILGYEPYREMTLGDLRKDASTFSAYMLMEHLLPSWKAVERNYYASGSLEMRDAHVYMNENNWEGAYKLWKQVDDKNKKGQKRMKAAFNLAVYHEAHDETEQAVAYVEEALKWVKKDSYDDRMMNIYLLQLNSRIEKRKALDMQMRRFE